jgi:hypothetical protein
VHIYGALPQHDEEAHPGANSPSLGPQAININALERAASMRPNHTGLEQFPTEP